MKYPENIRGPRFDQGDFVTFTFDGAELTLRLPVVPVNRQNEDMVSPVRDFRGIDTHDWNTDAIESHSKMLVQQAWAFEDAISFDDIAFFRLFISVVEASKEQVEKNTLLEFKSFEQAILDLYGTLFENGEDKNPSSPALANRYHGKPITNEYLDWLNVKFFFVEGSTPKPVAMIPINNRFFIIASVEVDRLRYPDRENPYSKQLLGELELDMFDEFIQHIDLRYTPETIATIDSLKKKK